MGRHPSVSSNYAQGMGRPSGSMHEATSVPGSGQSNAGAAGPEIAGGTYGRPQGSMQIPPSAIAGVAAIKASNTNNFFMFSPLSKGGFFYFYAKTGSIYFR